MTWIYNTLDDRQGEVNGNTKGEARANVKRALGIRAKGRLPVDKSGDKTC